MYNASTITTPTYNVNLGLSYFGEKWNYNQRFAKEGEALERFSKPSIKRKHT